MFHVSPITWWQWQSILYQIVFSSQTVGLFSSYCQVEIIASCLNSEKNSYLSPARLQGQNSVVDNSGNNLSPQWSGA